MRPPEPESNLSPHDLAFRAFRHGWDAAIERAGGMVHRSWSASLDWDQIKREEFDGYWQAETRVWEAMAEMAKQDIAHKLARDHPGQVMPVPHVLPSEKIVSGMEVE